MTAPRHLHPAYFALVMATEIVAAGCALEGLPETARILTIVGAVAFVVLAALTLARLVLYPREFFHDFGSHKRGVGFFTIVAAVAFLSSNLNALLGLGTPARILWVAGIILWLLLTYGIFAALIVAPHKPSLETGMHAGWLLAVVATESLADATLHLPPGPARGHPAVLFFALALWSSGIMLYIWMISLIFYRYTFFVVGPSELLPSYWIDMGGMAVASAVGALLVRNIAGSVLANLAPFIEGLSVLCWATATWWIPMLAVLAVWRLSAPGPLQYNPLYWGAVFPLGTYTVATWYIAGLTKLTFLYAIPHYFIYIALSAWAIAALAMLVHLLRRAPQATA